MLAIPSSTSRHVFARTTKNQLAHRDLLMPQISIIGLCVIIKRIIEPVPNPTRSSFAQKGWLKSLTWPACGLFSNKYWRIFSAKHLFSICIKYWRQDGNKIKKWMWSYSWSLGWFIPPNNHVWSIWHTYLTHIEEVLPASWHRGARWRGWSTGGETGGSRLTWDLTF